MRQGKWGQDVAMCPVGQEQRKASRYVAVPPVGQKRRQMCECNAAHPIEREQKGDVFARHCACRGDASRQVGIVRDAWETSRTTNSCGLNTSHVIKCPTCQHIQWLNMSVARRRTGSSAPQGMQWPSAPASSSCRCTPWERSSCGTRVFWCKVLWQKHLSCGTRVCWCKALRCKQLS